MGLSAAASIVLKYVRARAVDGTAEIGDDAPFSDDVLISACRELKQVGLISGYELSDCSVELVHL